MPLIVAAPCAPVSYTSVRPAEPRTRMDVFARVPLASGMLSGNLRADSVFSERDHRHFNRHGESFDMDEAFSGVDYDTGLRAVEELRALVPAGATMAQLALRGTLMFPEVTAAIPDARNVPQVESNVGAATLTPLSEATMAQVVREAVRVYTRKAGTATP